MITHGERLNWMLKALNLSGKDLAAQIGVDASTMSKWRKGKRPLRYGSEYSQAIAQRALNCPAEKNGHILRSMLLDISPELDISDESVLNNALCIWFAVPEIRQYAPAEMSGSVAPEVQIESLVGLENMFEVQRSFFCFLDALPPGQLVTVTDFCAIDWQHVDKRLIEQGVADNLKCMLAGHKVRIVDQLTETYRPWDLMFQWLPIYLQKNVSTYFYRNPKPFPMRQNIYIIKGCAAMTVSSTDESPGLIITALYRQPEYIRFFEAIVKTVMQDSQRMSRTMEVEMILPFLDVIDQHIKSSRLLYLINRLPTFLNMPPELLCDVLRDNNVIGEQFDVCLSAGRKSTLIRVRCESRQIYDLDAIEFALEQPWIIDYDLSAIVGREIRVMRARFIEQLEYLYSHVEDKNYAIVLFPFSRLEMDALPPCNIIAQDGSLSAAWDAEKYPCRMYSEDFSIVNGFYQYAESVWAHIPPVCKSHEWCMRRIGVLLT